MTAAESAVLGTPLCERPGAELPIISAGMGPIAGPEMVAAVSNAGGLGVLGYPSVTADEVRDHVPARFGWGTPLVIGTGRADPRDALFPALRGEQPALAAESDAMRTADDAPFRRPGEAGVTGARRFPLRIPVHDHVVRGGDGDVFASEWGQRWHELIPHSIWDELPDTSHFLQDTHGEQIARVILRHADQDEGRAAEP